MPQHPDEQVPVRHHAVDLGAGQCRGEQPTGLGPGRRPGDHLREHGIVVHTDGVAVHNAGVEAQPGRDQRTELAGDRGYPEAVQRSGRRQPRVGRILGVETGLDRVAAQRWCAVEGQHRALGDEQSAGVRDRACRRRTRLSRARPAAGCSSRGRSSRRSGRPRTRPCRRRRSRLRAPPRWPRRRAGRAVSGDTIGDGVSSMIF